MQQTKYVSFGDITSIEEGILVHGCNAQGVMGAGIARAVKAKWPNAFVDYQKLINSHPLHDRVGRVAWSDNEKVLVANSITQLNFGNDEKKQYVSYKAMHQCFEYVAQMAGRLNMHVHYPMIGAGLGGGDWAIISDIIETVFSSFAYQNIPRTLWIYE
jgi:O-acetyl-ADP-ribose deacetylase (regulator of RNase III)